MKNAPILVFCDMRRRGIGPPIVFETNVFDDYGEAYDHTRSYCTYAAAEVGHLETVDAVAERLGVTVEGMAAGNTG